MPSSVAASVEVLTFDPQAGGGGPVYTTSPYGVAGAIAWYKADTETFQDTAFTTPATADAAPVGGWRDQTGLNNSVTQATAGSRPTLRLNQKNGLPVVRFDGVDDSLTALFTETITATVFVVLRFVVWTNNRYILSGGAGDKFSVYMAIGSPVWRVWNGATTVQANGAITAGTWFIMQLRMAAANSILGENALAPVNAGGFAFDATAGGLTMGAHVVSGFAGNVEIGELIFYNVALSDANVTTVRNALNARWLVF
jgi:hypothetical protein